MKTYKVTVNGTAYEITLEAIDAASASVPAKAAEKTETPAPASTPVVSAAAGGETVTSPMPGTILAVNVKSGDSVKKGDVLVILEAMKMENEILAPCDGTVSSVSVANGAAVDTGAVLCVIA